jgi:DNA-binding CsgD family transcriptional regulator
MTLPGQVELTPRQQQILQLLQAGKVNKEVARELDIGLGTVKQHIVAIFRKLNVRNRTAAAFRNMDRQVTDAPASLIQSPKILLSARPCVVLGIALPPNSDSAMVRQLYGQMASLSSAHDAIFLTRQGQAGELIFGVNKVTEYDAALALHLASQILETMIGSFPALAGKVRGCLTAGIGFASMRRYGGWSGEAIASAAISAARDLLQITQAGFFTCDQPARDLCEAFGVSGIPQLGEALPFEALASMQWSGERTARPLVGRSQELKVLQAAIKRATLGKGSIVILEGEMGMGKSRICQALHELGLARNLKTRFYRRLPNVLGSGLLDVVRGEHHGVDRCIAEVRSQAPQTRHFVIVDDFHLLEPQEQAAWFEAAIQGRAKGLLTLFAGRKGSGRTTPPDVEQVRLSRLGVHHMQALIRQALDMPAGKKRSSIMQTILDTSTGVPLFALEMARMPDPIKLSLPLMVAVHSRIDKFGLDNSVLRLVASNQGGIAIDRIAELTGDPLDTLRAQVDRATATGVLTQQVDGMLTFTHPMIRRVIANSIMD